MSFVTTCPQCKTSFRVDQDQLERGRGQVRCGVCKRVFAGADHLRYLAELPEAVRPPAASDASRPAAARGADEGVRGDSGAMSPGSRVPAGAPLFPAPRPGEWDPLQALAESPQSDTRDGRITSRDEADRTRHAPGIDRTVAPENGRRLGLPGEARVGAVEPGNDEHRTGQRGFDERGFDERGFDERGFDQRGFDQQGLDQGGSDAKGSDESGTSQGQTIFTQTPARWRERAMPGGHETDAPRRATKSWQVYVLVALLLVAALQLMLLFRSEIVTRVPALRPVADVVAGAFGLSVEGIRSIASLSIESTELQRTGSNGQVALHVLLRNKDGRTVRWPALELTLTDPAGTVVLRKVLLPSDYLPAGAPRDGLRARSEWPIRLGLDAGGLPLANYSVNPFYP